MIANNAWLTAIVMAVILVAGLVMVEIVSNLVAPGVEVLAPHQTPFIGESWCIRADGGPCP
ncbi:hypothetical protein LCGC14_1356740 [marine sediment metagenome]|uniref:Uncharacterized protein n=1 Tax=marine sediment metagenome TaxID=412755 RepID=A0A0F9MPT7_9ZZZZ